MIAITVPAFFLVVAVALFAPDYLDETMAGVALVLTHVFAILNEFGP